MYVGILIAASLLSFDPMDDDDVVLLCEGCGGRACEPLEWRDGAGRSVFLCVCRAPPWLANIGVWQYLKTKPTTTTAASDSAQQLFDSLYARMPHLNLSRSKSSHHPPSPPSPPSPPPAPRYLVYDQRLQSHLRTLADSERRRTSHEYQMLRDYHDAAFACPELQRYWLTQQQRSLTNRYWSIHMLLSLFVGLVDVCIQLKLATLYELCCRMRRERPEFTQLVFRYIAAVYWPTTDDNGEQVAASSVSVNDIARCTLPEGFGHVMYSLQQYAPWLLHVDGFAVERRFVLAIPLVANSTIAKEANTLAAIASMRRVRFLTSSVPNVELCVSVTRTLKCLSVARFLLFVEFNTVFRSMGLLSAGQKLAFPWSCIAGGAIHDSTVIPDAFTVMDSNEVRRLVRESIAMCTQLLAEGKRNLMRKDNEERQRSRRLAPAADGAAACAAAAAPLAKRHHADADADADADAEPRLCEADIALSSTPPVVS